MDCFKHNEKEYKVDSYDYLTNPDDWDENYAEGMSKKQKIEFGLTKEHWKVLNFIRSTYQKVNCCPCVSETIKKNSMQLSDIKRLFPTGYQRGACKIAGATFKDAFLSYYYMDKAFYGKVQTDKNKVYPVDFKGFIVDPTEWDENFTVFKAEEMKMPSLLTDKHWEVIYFIRDSYFKTGVMPTLNEVCEENELNYEEFENLFPDGYQRGAIKLAGLKEE